MTGKLSDPSTARRLSTERNRERLSAFAAFLRQHHLTELAEVQLRINRQLDIPLLRLFEHLSEPEMLELVRVGLEEFLENLENGRALLAAAESLRLWEADQLPGIPKHSIQASDLVLVYVAQEQALLSFLDRYTTDVDEVLSIARELRAYYAAAQDEAFKLFQILREQAIEEAAQAHAAQLSAEAAQEELQALNEELATQQEELSQLYSRLQQQHEAVESEVARRTEELQAANEELAAQTEELLSQQDEVNNANLELAHQKALLTGVLNNVPGSIGYCDRHFVIRAANRRYADDLGKRVDELLNHPAPEVIPGLTPEMLAALQAVLDTGKPMVGIGQPTPRVVDGMTREVYQDFSVVPVYHEDGSPDGLLSLSVDVTERVMLEREVSRQRMLLERIISQAPAGIAYLDADLIVRQVNPAFLTMFDRPAEYFLDQHILRNSKPEMHATFEPLLKRVLATGETHVIRAVPYELTLDGVRTQVYWDLSYVPAFGEGGQVEGILVFTQDVSARVVQEQSQQGQIAHLKELDEMKDRFLSALSFQLGTPINAIMGYASVLEEGAIGGPLKDDQRDYVRRIMATSQVQLALVNDLLDLSRMSGGKFTLRREPLDIADAARRVLDALSPLIEQQAQRTVSYLPTGLPKALADEQRIEQVLTNCIHTAVRMTPPGGMIRVEVKPEPGGVRVEVQDAGRPLDATQAATAIEHGTQLGGTWLGFSITKRLVEAHGGRMGIQSEADIGNIFWFSLPGA